MFVGIEFYTVYIPTMQIIVSSESLKPSYFFWAFKVSIASKKRLLIAIPSSDIIAILFNILVLCILH